MDERITSGLLNRTQAKNAVKIVHTKLFCYNEKLELVHARIIANFINTNLVLRNVAFDFSGAVLEDFSFLYMGGLVKKGF